MAEVTPVETVSEPVVESVAEAPAVEEVAEDIPAEAPVEAVVEKEKEKVAEEKIVEEPLEPAVQETTLEVPEEVTEEVTAKEPSEEVTATEDAAEEVVAAELNELETLSQQLHTAVAESSDDDGEDASVEPVGNDTPEVVEVKALEGIEAFQAQLKEQQSPAAAEETVEEEAVETAQEAKEQTPISRSTPKPWLVSMRSASNWLACSGLHIELKNCFDLDRHPRRQRRGPYSTACSNAVFFTKNVAHQLAESVDDGRLFGESDFRLHQAKCFYETFHTVEAAAVCLERCQRCKACLASRLKTGGDVEVGLGVVADATADQRLVCLERPMPRQIGQVTNYHDRPIQAHRLGSRRKFEFQRFKTGFVAHGILSWYSFLETELILVDLFWVEDSLADNFEFALDALAKKATDVAFVTGGAALLRDFQQDCVGVAVDVNLSHLLQIATFFAFFPKSAAAAAVVDRLASSERLLPGVSIHVGEHQHLARRKVLSNCRQQGIVGGKIRAMGHSRIRQLASSSRVRNFSRTAISPTKAIVPACRSKR